MNYLVNYSLGVRTAVFSYEVVLLFSLLYGLVRSAWYRRRVVPTTLAVVIIFVQYYLVQYIITCLLKENNFMMQGGMVFMMELPLWAVLIVQAAGTVFFIYQQVSITKWIRNHILPSSIKESVDELPDGLCYYWEGGFPKLVNAKMEKLSRQMTGSSLMNAEMFWAMLCSGGSVDGAVCVSKGDQPIWRTADGNFYSFRRKEKELEGRPLFELIASDVTKEYLVGEKLREKRIKEEEINDRLREIGRNLTKMAMEKEVLEMKINVHDNLGQALLMTKQYWRQPDSCSKEELLYLWQSVVTLLQSERPESWQDSYVEGFRRASLLGVKLVVNGELPETEMAKRLVNLAVSTCATNVLRHAGGSELEISGARTEDVWTLIFTNDGRNPEGEIRETGGLKNLRREVESAGGVMRVQSLPGFALFLVLAVEERG